MDTYMPKIYPAQPVYQLRRPVVSYWKKLTAFETPKQRQIISYVLHVHKISDEVDYYWKNISKYLHTHYLHLICIGMWLYQNPQNLTVLFKGVRTRRFFLALDRDSLRSWRIAHTSPLICSQYKPSSDFYWICLYCSLFEWFLLSARILPFSGRGSNVGAKAIACGKRSREKDVTGDGPVPGMPPTSTPWIFNAFQLCGGIAAAHFTLPLDPLSDFARNDT